MSAFSGCMYFSRGISEFGFAPEKGYGSSAFEESACFALSCQTRVYVTGTVKFANHSSRGGFCGQTRFVVFLFYILGEVLVSRHCAESH